MGRRGPIPSLDFVGSTSPATPRSINLATVGSGPVLTSTGPPSPPVNTLAPVVSNTPDVGNTLVTTDGTWTGSPTLAYEWLRDGTPISGATANTYLLVSGDATHTIRSRVTATNDGGSTSAQSNAVGPVLNVPLPTALSPLLAWWDAETGRFSAESGGSPVTTNAAVVKGFSPRAGSETGRMTQPTDNVCAVFDAAKNALCFAQGIGGRDSFYNSPPIVIDRQDFSIFFILELITLREGSILGVGYDGHYLMQSVASTLNLLYPGTDATSPRGQLTAFNNTAKPAAIIPWAGSRVMIGFVGRPFDFRAYVNEDFVAGAGLTAGNTTVLGWFGITSFPSPCQLTLLDTIVYDRALTDAEVSDNLIPYAESRGVVTTFTANVVFVGDSEMISNAATLNRGLMQNMTLPPDVRRNCTAQSGDTLGNLASQSAFEISQLKGGENNIVVVWAGTNDIAGGASAADVYATMTSYTSTLQGGGAKVVLVTPLPRGVGAIAGQYAALRTMMLANAAGADGVADPIGNPTLAAGWQIGVLSLDGIHPNDPGYLICSAVVQATIEPLL